MAADVPIVEIAGDADHFGVGGPYGEADSGDAVNFDQMRAQAVPGLVVGALGVEVQVEAAEQGSEAVGVLDFLDSVLLSLDAQAVAAGGAVERGFEKALGVEAFQLNGSAVLTQRGDAPGLGQEGAQGPAAVGGGLRTEDGERVAMVAADNSFQFTRLHGPIIAVARIKGRDRIHPWPEESGIAPAP